MGRGTWFCVFGDFVWGNLPSKIWSPLRRCFRYSDRTENTTAIRSIVVRETSILAILRAQLRTPFIPLNTIVLCWSEVFQGGPQLFPHDAERRLYPGGVWMGSRCWVAKLPKQRTEIVMCVGQRYSRREIFFESR